MLALDPEGRVHAPLSTLLHLQFLLLLCCELKSRGIAEVARSRLSTTPPAVLRLPHELQTAGLPCILTDEMMDARGIYKMQA